MPNRVNFTSYKKLSTHKNAIAKLALLNQLISYLSWQCLVFRIQIQIEI